LSRENDFDFGNDASHIEVVTRYLELTARRRLTEAEAFLAKEAVLVFSNGTFSDLAAMVEAAGGRYRRIGKTYETWDVAHHNDGSVVVVNTGTLHGVNHHGASFDGIRYIDRFVLRGGKIVLQQVWNDLVESGALDRLR